MVGQDAQQPRNPAKLHQVAFILFVRDGEQHLGRIGLGLPEGFHGRQLGGLDLGHLAGVVMPLDQLGDGEDQGKGEAQAKGLGEKVGMLPAQQVIGADPHDEKARQDVSPADGMEKYLEGKRLEDDGQEVIQFGPAVAQDVAHRMLHPGIGDQNPDGREVGGQGHQPDADGVELGRKPVPAEDPHRQKGGFQEKGQGGFDGQERAEDVPHVAGVPGPVGAELELQGDAGHHPHGKVDDEDFSPEFCHPPVFLVSGPDVDRLHDGDEDG